jgi:hypothetical protein
MYHNIHIPDPSHLRLSHLRKIIIGFAISLEP